MGKAIWENPFEVRLGEGFQLGIQNIDPMWKVLNKEGDSGEPTSFFDHVFLGCTQRQCEISKDIVDSCRTMFELRISAGGTEKRPCSENLRISSWSYDMEGQVILKMSGFTPY